MLSRRRFLARVGQVVGAALLPWPFAQKPRGHTFTITRIVAIPLAANLARGRDTGS